MSPVVINTSGLSVTTGPGDFESAVITSAQGSSSSTDIGPTCTETLHDTLSDFTISTHPSFDHATITVGYSPAQISIDLPAIVATDTQVETWNDPSCGPDQTLTFPGDPNSGSGLYPPGPCGDNVDSTHPTSVYPATDLTHIVGSCDNVVRDTTDPSGLNVTETRASWDLTLSPTADSDGDGLPDVQELTSYGTSPVNADTDGDGYSDSTEIAAGTNPLDAMSFPGSPSPSPSPPPPPSTSPTPVAPSPSPSSTGDAPTASPSGGASASPSPSATQSPTSRVLAYVALGDSFSSGEGACYDAPDDCHTLYLPGTNVVGQDECHRSRLAYPFVARHIRGAVNMFDFACSGAVIDNLYSAMTRDNHIEKGEGYQLASLKQVVADPANKVNTVSIGMGGNDANFSDIIKDCVIGEAALTTGCPQNVVKQGDLPNWPDIAYRATAAYRQLATAAPDATVYVMGYPRLFAATPQRRCIITPGDVSFLNGIDSHLNTVLRDSARAAYASGARVVYVDQYAAYNGHERCANGYPWLNGLLGNPASPHVESFHPNFLGQGQFAIDLSWCTIPGHTTAGYCKPPVPIVQSPSVSAKAIVAGSAITVAAGGFLPNESVTATLHTTVLKLGALAASVRGLFKHRLRIPARVRPGWHTIVLTGGRDHRKVTLRIRVLGRRI